MNRIFDKQESYWCLVLSMVHIKPETSDWLEDQAKLTLDSHGLQEIVVFNISRQLGRNRQLRKR